MVWRIQPPDDARVIVGHPLLRGKATHVFARDHRRNLIDNKAPTWNGAAPLGVTQLGVGADLYNGGTKRDHYSSAAGVNDRRNWTYAAIVQNASASTRGSIAIIANARGDVTRDRSLSILATGLYEGYIYTGASVTVTGTKTVSTTRPQAVVLSADGATLRLFVDGVMEASASIANNGYNGFDATPELCVGFGDRADAGTTSVSTLPLFMRLDGYAWGVGEARAFYDNPWQMFAPAQGVRRYFVGVAAGAGAQTLLPSLVTDSDTFHSPTVSVGAVTLQPSLVTDGDTFYAATVTVDGGPQTLLPALFEDGDTFHSATVTTGAVTLQPSLVTDADTFHSPTVTSGLLLQPSLVTDDDTFHSPTVTVGAVDLTPALFVNSQSFYVATVSSDGSPQTLAPARYDNDATFYAHEVVRQILAGEATDSRHRARIGSAIAGASSRVGTPIAGPKRRIGKTSP